LEFLSRDKSLSPPLKIRTIKVQQTKNIIIAE
jgi:hypothetical protein